jgi:hypothetical protein
MREREGGKKGGESGEEENDRKGEFFLALPFIFI